MVIGRVMPDARAAAMLLQEIGRVGHALHAARDHGIDGADGNRLCAHDHRLHARAANLVDGGGLDGLGQPGLDPGLAGGGLSKTGGQHAAHIDAVHILTLHTGALHGTFDGGCAKLGRADIGQRTLHRAHGRAGIGQNDDGIGTGHGKTASLLISCLI